MLAAASADGLLSIWDLEASQMDPVDTHNLGTAATAVAMAANHPVVVAGSADGDLHVFRLRGLQRPMEDVAEDQAKRLESTIEPKSFAELT